MHYRSQCSKDAAPALRCYVPYALRAQEVPVRPRWAAARPHAPHGLSCDHDAYTHHGMCAVSHVRGPALGVPRRSYMQSRPSTRTCCNFRLSTVCALPRGHARARPGSKGKLVALRGTPRVVTRSHAHMHAAPGFSGCSAQGEGGAQALRGRKQADAATPLAMTPAGSEAEV